MKKLLFIMLGAAVLTGCEEVNFACDQTTAEAAADLINENYEQFGGALELTNPETVKSEPNHIYCRAKANVNVKNINYEVIKKSDGEIYIGVNPLSDAFDEALDEMPDFDIFD